MSSVGASNFGAVFQQYDLNGDSQLSRAEIARASIGYLGRESEADQSMGSLLGTLAAGGQNGSAVLPDFDGNGQVSQAEIAQLAAQSGNQGAIEGSDLRSVAPNYQGGQQVQLSTLETLAQGAQPDFSSAQGFSGALNSLLGDQQGGGQDQFLQLFLAIFSLLGKK